MDVLRIMTTVARATTVRLEAAAPSAAAELGWLLDLLVQTARYAEPAVEELDRSLLPGVAALREPIKERFTSLWKDGVAGCPELVVTAADGGCLSDPDPHRLFAWLSRLPAESRRHLDLRRMARLDTDIRLRRAYRDILAEVWRLAEPVWQKRGRALAAAAARDWTRRLPASATVAAVLELMPPRHPLTRMSRPTATALLRRRQRVSVVPIYFCMSGGELADLGDRLHVGVPASALEPIRHTRDAAFVADRLRVLSEPTRVRILIHLMSVPSGVMEMTRALGMSQPTVSEHVRVLAAAGLVRPSRRRSRTAYAVSRRRVERLIEDARATLARWA
jgi:ArsR family transcriptional regulator, zinc-responsive transcriptional repressor